MNGTGGGLKGEVRQRFRAALRQLLPEQRAEDAAAMRRRLRDQQEWQQAQAVLFYVPIPGEPDLWSLAEERWGEGRLVLLPRYVREGDRYEACLVRGPRELQTGAFGILEPGPGCPLFPLNQLDLSLVPGIAFTLDGGRLGRGKGYYDRLLAAVSGFKCGVAFDCQVAEALPLEPHDVQLNCILTPTRWHPVVGPSRS